MKLVKNQNLIVNILNLGINGEGIAKYYDWVIFVPFALPQEEVEIKILKVKGSIAFAKLINVLKPSKHRVEPNCPIFTKCGGCQLQHLSYNKQLEFKENLVEETLKKVGNIAFGVNNAVGSNLEYNYRNKISLPIREVNNELKIGFFAGGSHRIIETAECPLQMNLTSNIIKVFKQFMTTNNIKAYNEKTKKGLVKHLVARQFKNKLQVAVVINGKTMPNINQLKEMLENQFGFVSLYLNHNTMHNNVILGKTSTHMFGDKYLIEEVKNLKVKTNINSFMQVNNYIRDEIYNQAINEVIKLNPDTIIDAFSGAGLLTGMLGKNTEANVIGLEIVEAAVKASNKLMSENNIINVKNVLGDATVTLPQVIKEVNGKTSVILDPPRKGVSKEVVNAILKAQPDQIIYIACGLTSLARDLGYLINTLNIETSKFNENPKPIYKIKSITPYDMFPQTKHIETVALLELVGE